MASHRIGARVAGLSPAQLCAIIEAQSGASDAALRVAEEHAARLVEQPEWVLSEVLLSPDLAPHILAHLPTTEHAAKGTCRAWRRGWKEALKKRERPHLLVIGGYGGDGERLNSLERFDPSTNEWEEEEAVAPMPTARNYAGMAVLDGKLYAAGGQLENQAVLVTANLVERYDLATNAWEAVSSMLTARAQFGMAVLDGRLYAAGGVNEDDGALSSVERYDPATNAWEEVAPMAETRHEDVAVLDGKLYAMGGINNGALGSVERYDPVTNVWEEVMPMATARFSHAVAVLDGKLYAVGGYSNGALGSVDRYDPIMTNVWEEAVPMTRARHIHMAWRCSTARCMLWAAPTAATTTPA